MPLAKYQSEKMLNTKQAALLLGVSTKTIYRMEEKGLIRSVRTPGGQRRFPKNILDTYISNSVYIIAPQNPGRFRASNYIRETLDAPYLFDTNILTADNAIDQKVNNLENQVALNISQNHKKHYDNTVTPKQWIEEWDFKTSHTKTYTHGFHTYPAMFIPQVARKLISAFSNEGDIVCDIFCGSGTTLVESSLLNRNSIGIELNPLAVLIARVKTVPLDSKSLTSNLKTVIASYGQIKEMEIPVFKNIDFWFGKKVIKDLSRLKKAIKDFTDENIRNFFYVCFSEVVRIVSYTRHGEFKLFRSPDKLTDKFNPNILNEFMKICEKNILGMREYHRDFSKNTNVRVIEGDATKDNGISYNSIDLIITSPPYGDSRTTVAYGQFSRLSAQWLDLLPSDTLDIDRILLGGKNSVNLDDSILNESETLKTSIELIANKDLSRAKDVLSFYIDLNKSLKQAQKILKPQKYFCLIVGNRTVKDLVLKTDTIICELGEKIGFVSNGILYRNIPNKRMPLKNSPTNESGKTGYTMQKESIVLLKKS